MTLWQPEWKVTLNGYGDYTNLTLSNLTITSGRTDIYSQPKAGYCNVSIINLDEAPIEVDVNDQISIQVKDSNGDYVSIFGGFVTDISLEVISAGTNGVNSVVNIMALGALSKLPKILTTGVLTKAFDGTQIASLLEGALLGTWNEVPAATAWNTYTATTTWANAENSGIGTIDQPGDYELTSRSSLITDLYSLVASLATSGLGYIYEDAQGRIGYADSTRRNSYFTTNGYTELTGNHALARGIKTIKRSGDVRNYVEIEYKNNAKVTDQDDESIALYGQQAYQVFTTLENGADATAQAAYYLGLRAFPQSQFQSIIFPLSSSEIDDADRDALLNVFMGLPLRITDLPNNMTNGQFEGFVEGWTFSAGYNNLNLTLTVSPLAYSIQSVRWNGVNPAETWNTLSNTLEWENATIVA